LGISIAGLADAADIGQVARSGLDRLWALRQQLHTAIALHTDEGAVRMSHKTEALFNGVEGLFCLGAVVHIASS
jgi:hypothetical protein